MLTDGGNNKGKTHGAGPSDAVGAAPEGAGIEDQQFGWLSTYNSGVGADAITSGLEVVWSKTPTKWSNAFLNSLFHNEWTLETGPGGNWQWTALNGTRDYPRAFDNTTFDLPRMLTSDLSLRQDPTYANISMTYLNDFDKLTNDFAHAW